MTRPSSSRRPRPAATSAAPLVVAGAPFSGATTLAWALGQHPQLQPVVGAGAAGDRPPRPDRRGRTLALLAPPSRPPLRLRGRRLAWWVISGDAITQRLDSQAFPEFGSSTSTGGSKTHRRTSWTPLVVTAHGSRRRRPARSGIRGWTSAWPQRSSSAPTALLRMDYDDLAHQPEEALARCLALAGKPAAEQCLWPLRLLATALPAHTGAPSGRPLPRPRRRDTARVTPATRPAAAPTRRGSRPRTRDRARREPRRRRAAALPDRSGSALPAAPRRNLGRLLPGRRRRRPSTISGARRRGRIAPRVSQGRAVVARPLRRAARSISSNCARAIACDVEVASSGSSPRIAPRAAGNAQRPPEARRTGQRTRVHVEQRSPPPPRRRKLGGSLWAVTTFYNPAGYRYEEGELRALSRSRWRDSGVPLLTVELAFGDAPFELAGPTTPSQLVQLRGGDVLWQKERLLNIGMRCLPDDCDKVAWLDADVLFARDGLGATRPRGCSNATSSCSPSRIACACRARPRTCEPAMLPFGPRRGRSSSTGSRGASSEGSPRASRATTATDTPASPGRRVEALLERHGLYDAEPARQRRHRHRACDVRERRLLGARRSSASVPARISDAGPSRSPPPSDGSVAHVDGVVTHLWHGDPQHRLYDRPLDVLHGFDPDRDLAQTVRTGSTGGRTPRRPSSARGRATTSRPGGRTADAVPPATSSASRCRSTDELELVGDRVARLQADLPRLQRVVLLRTGKRHSPGLARGRRDVQARRERLYAVDERRAWSSSAISRRSLTRRRPGGSRSIPTPCSGGASAGCPPGTCFFGTIQGGLPGPSLQGGCIGGTRAAVAALAESGALLAPRAAANPSSRGRVATRISSHGRARVSSASTSSMRGPAVRSAFRCVEFEEIRSEWRQPPPDAKALCGHASAQGARRRRRAACPGTAPKRSPSAWSSSLATPSRPKRPWPS